MKDKQFKPMLAAEADLSKLHFPLIASPKLDGVRALVKDGVVLSRSLKPIPNKHVQALFGRPELEGLDGELIVGSPTDEQCFQNTSGAVRRTDGEPDVRLYVFDKHDLKETFRIRTLVVREMCEKAGVPVIYLPSSEVKDRTSLDVVEARFLFLGYEGVILRDPDSPYKFGRSTAKEGYLLKLKQFKDSEARIKEVVELMHNNNEAKTNELGRTERSSHKENLVGAGTMGALFVEDIHTGQCFHIGTGFSAEQRKEFWEKRSWLTSTGIVVKYKYFPVGVKDLPRHPVYLGIREGFDMDSQPEYNLLPAMNSDSAS